MGDKNKNRRSAAKRRVEEKVAGKIPGTVSYKYADNVRVRRKSKPGKASVSYQEKIDSPKYKPPSVGKGANYKSTSSRKGKVK